MTTTRDSYQHLINTLSTVLPSSAGWYRLTDPNDISENFDRFLSKGWCLIPDSGENTNRKLSSVHTFRRTYTVQLSVQIFGAGNTFEAYDDSMKLILESSEALQLAIINDQTLGSDDEGIVARLIGDSGVIPIDAEDGKGKYLTMTVSIDIEIFYKYNC
jgi:hypothetical protein